ncbi:MAG: TolC family protein [Terriglobia bacterium]|jgi:outer membrane protein TolC|nr:TolC family protein [Terriglobia bacterium]
MPRIGKQSVLLITSCLLAGCAVRHYHPAPIVPSKTASQFELRSLADAGLRSFEEQNLGHLVSQWPPKSWDLHRLSLAALYFNPALDSARARVATAEGAMITAGERPNPTMDLAPGVPAPYLLSQNLLFLLETAGKRGLRIQGARNLHEAAQFDLADSAWNVAMGIRVALLNYLVASRNLGLLQSEEKARADQVAILEQILEAGENTRFDVDLARLELSRTTAAVRSAEVQLADARSALATAIGVPMAALDGVEFSWPEMDTLPPADSLSVDQVRRDAVLNRLNIRRALAQYAAAEADLHSEIAKQYPNFNLGPGYSYEEGHSYFTVGFSTTLPIFNRNQGPIAEAEGRREQAAAAFLQTQAQVIEKTERAFAVYKAALRAYLQAESSYQLQQSQLQIVQHNISAGAGDRLSLDAVEIQLSAVAQAQLNALGRAQAALGDLEDSVQRPLVTGDMFPVNSGPPGIDKLQQQRKP